MTSRADRQRRRHDEFRLLAAAAVDGRIDADDAAALEAHLATCAACRADQEAMYQDHVWLATPRRIEAPAQHVREAVLEAARSARVPRTGAARPWAAFAAAALVVAFVGGGVLLALRSPSVGSGSPTLAPTPTPTAEPSVRVPPQASDCIPIPPGISARFPFDEPGVDWISASDSKLVGNARIVAGHSTWGAIEFPDDASFATFNEIGRPDLGSADFTIALWVRFSTVSGEQVMLEQFGPSPVAGWSLLKLESGELRLAVATNDGEFDVDTSGVVLPAGVFHHVAARRQGSKFSILLDGRTVGSRDLGGTTTADLAAQLPIVFGRRAGESGLGLRGALDEVMIWAGRSLSDVEVDQLVRAGSGEFCEAAFANRFEGIWVAKDCATLNGVEDCDRWGDRSDLRMEIGAGERPDVRFDDSSVAGCGSDGTAGPRVATGRGTFNGVHLEVVFSSVSCGRPADSWSNPRGLYRGPGEGGIWDDPDGDSWVVGWLLE